MIGARDGYFGPGTETPLERIRQIDAENNAIWSAQDLMPVLGYSNWQQFKKVVLRARLVCETSGYDPYDHVQPAAKILVNGMGVAREVEDFHLSRYVCYMIVMECLHQRSTSEETAVD